MKTMLCAALLFMGVSATVSASNLKVEVVRELHKITSSVSGLVALNEHVFVTDIGRSDYKESINVYSADGSTLLASASLNHSARHIASYGQNAVIITGRTYEAEWTSYFTIASFANGQLSLKHQILGTTVIVERAVSDGKNIYFNEKGTRGVYQLKGRSLQKLNVEIHGPRQMFLDNGILTVLELGNLFSQGDETIISIELKHKTNRRLAQGTTFYGARSILVMKGTDQVLATEILNNSVAIIDIKADRIVDSFEVPVGAYGMTQYGKCAVIVSDKTKELSFVRIDANGSQLVAQWDLSSAGDRLKLPREVQMNFQTGTAFVRSAYVCSSCVQTQSSVFAFSDNGQVKALCN
jgi:hypothetical protein